MPVIYSARWVLPVIAAPIEQGAVAINETRIVGVASRAELSARFPNARVEDFGEAAIIPGLVNTHAHLELTAMRGFLEREEHNFFAWLKKLTVTRLAMTNEDLLVSATCGAIEAARAGVTCLGDSSSFAVQSMKALKEVGLRGVVYQESFGPDPNLAGENFVKLRAQLDELRAHETDVVHAGVSPHAPYTVSAPQLQLISRLAIDEQLPLMMHAAESNAEQLLMLEGLGPFAEGLRSRGIEWHAPGVSTIQYLDRVGVLETKPLLAHCINVNEADLETIQLKSAAIAHCPKSNAKLGHGRAPFAHFLAHRINVGLGSDSVASNNNCDILEEARFATLLARVSSSSFSGGLPANSLTAADALFTATLGGAAALGLGNQIGALKDGMQADLAVVNLGGAHQQPVSNPSDTLIFSSSGRDVILTMVAGKEVYRTGVVNTVSEPELRTRMSEIRTKFDAVA